MKRDQDETDAAALVPGKLAASFVPDPLTRKGGLLLAALLPLEARGAS
jgi:hypothetical protein